MKELLRGKAISRKEEKTCIVGLKRIEIDKSRWERDIGRWTVSAKTDRYVEKLSCCSSF
jgi:hypothetical protein